MILLRPVALVLLVGLIPLLVLARARPAQGRLRRLAVLLRGLGLALIALALAGPALPDRPAEVRGGVGVVVDVSSSVDPAAAVAAVQSVLAASPGAQLFAAAGRARPIGGAELAGAARGLDPEASDLAAGLRLAAASLARRGGAQRIVLISDGRATAGDHHREARALAARGVAVEEVRVASRPLALRAARPSRAWVRSGEPLRLEVVVERAGTLRVTRRGPDGATRRWARAVGPGRVTIDDRPRGRGLAVYALELAGEVSRVVVPVRRPPRARVLARPPGPGELVIGALREGGFAVEVAEPAAGVGGGHDLTVLVDVPLRGPGALAEADQRALVAQVRAGGGLLVIGGRRAFGPGGYRGSALEAGLPLLSQPSRGEQPTLALLLVVDRSSSMRGPKLELAKLAAGDALDQLAPRDLAGAIVFNQRAWWSIPLARGVEDVARARLETYAAGGGTDLGPALDLGVPALRAAAAKLKHVVVLTDGIFPRADALQARIAKLRGEGITLSTVALGGDADHAVLRRFAEAGGGRHHAVPVAADLPRILVRETRRVARLAGRTPAFQARRAAPGDVLRGVDVEASPALLGLADTQARPTATVWLTGAQGRPLLAGWDLGRGRVVAWTSDGGLAWARSWRNWDGFPQLLRQAARRLTPARLASPDPEPLRLRFGRERLRLEAAAPEELVVALGGPLERRLPVRAWATRRGELRWPDLPAGAYEVGVWRGSRLAGLEGRWLPEPGAERRAPARAVWRGAGAPAARRARWRRLDGWLLLAAALLLVVEVACRRVSR